MGLRALNLFIVALIVVNIAVAANIHGSVYDIYLEKKANTIVTINTTPKQNYITKDGFYEFNVPGGNYEIRAEYYEYNELKYFAKEQINIKDEKSNYTLDIILSPSFEEEGQIIEEEKKTEADDLSNKKLIRTTYFFIYGVSAVSMIFIIGGFIYYYRKSRKEKEKFISDISDDIVEFIKSQDGKTTQKEIRKNFDLSEGKISLVISELEKKEVIKKVKKGRGNIIILQK